MRNKEKIMAESLGARVGRVIAGSAHALIDRIEAAAPDAVMEQTLREVDKVVDDVRHELGMVAANRHLAQQQHANLNRQHTTLSTQVEEAITGGREDLARAAVGRQLDIEAQIPVLEKSLAQLTTNESELKGYLNALLAKRREMLDALDSYRAAQKIAAENSARPGESADNEQRLGAATTAFDRVYQRQTGLSPAAAGASLEQAARLKELDDMVRKNQIEERLAKLKAQQG
jgi:phage shock protein A